MRPPARPSTAGRLRDDRHRRGRPGFTTARRDRSDQGRRDGIGAARSRRRRPAGGDGPRLGDRLAPPSAGARRGFGTLPRRSASGALERRLGGRRSRRRQRRDSATGAIGAVIEVAHDRLERTRIHHAMRDHHLERASRAPHANARALLRYPASPPTRSAPQSRSRSCAGSRSKSSPPCVTSSHRTAKTVRQNSHP